MRNLFTMAFSAGLGVTAAVGASSIGFGNFSFDDSVSGARDAGVQFNAQNAAFEAQGADVRVALSPFSDTTVAFFEVSALDAPFVFKSIDLTTDIETGVQVTAVGLLDGVEIASTAFDLFGGPATFAPASFQGQSLDQLRLGSAGSFGGFGSFGGTSSGGSSAASASNVATVTSLFSIGETDEAPGTVALDNLELAEIAAVPVPASLVFFGTALAGFGIMRRRRKS